MLLIDLIHDSLQRIAKLLILGKQSTLKNILQQLFQIDHQ